MVNKYLALGYLSADPDYKKFESGKSKSSFSIAVMYGKDTTWIEVECWDKVADNSKNFLKKGGLVFVEGKFKTSSWKDKNGFQRSKLICVCDFFKSIQEKNKDKDSEAQHNVSEIMKEHSLDKDLEMQKDLEDIPW